MKRKVILYVLAFIVAIGTMLLVCGLKGLLTEQKSREDTLVILCDAFFVPGVIFLCFGALGWASDKGAFDGLGYSISSLFNLHKPAGRGLDWKEKESYQEYVERKHSPEKKTKPLNFMFIIGGTFILVSVILLIVYHAT